MRFTALALTAAALGLTGCAPGVDEITGPASAAAARAVVAPIVAQQVPGPTGADLTECIVENASEAELARISAANAGAPDDDTVMLVSDILARTETVACVTARLNQA